MLLLPYMKSFFKNKLKLFIAGHCIITNFKLLDVDINISVESYDKFCTVKYNYLIYMGMFYKYLHLIIHILSLFNHKYTSKK